MNIKNFFHVVFYLVLASLALWLFLATAQGFLIRSVPQAADYCDRWMRIPDDIDASERIAGSSYRCTDFKNSLERLKYDHNLRMIQRNRLLLDTIMALVFVVSIGTFYVIPKWQEKEYVDEKYSLGGAIVLGFVLAFSPIVLGTILPSPSQWAPDALNRYFGSLSDDALLELSRRAIEIDSQHRGNR